MIMAGKKILNLIIGQAPIAAHKNHIITVQKFFAKIAFPNPTFINLARDAPACAHIDNHDFAFI